MEWKAYTQFSDNKSTVNNYNGGTWYLHKWVLIYHHSKPLGTLKTMLNPRIC